MGSNCWSVASGVQAAQLDEYSNLPETASSAHANAVVAVLQGDRLAITMQLVSRFRVLAMNILRALTVLVLVFWGNALLSNGVSAQEINFDQINKFESLGTGTLHVGAPPKTVIDDGERHVVILTIWDADAETKVYWRSPDGNDARTTIIPGKGIQTFQTAGVFKLEAMGEPNHEVNYGYVLLGLRK